MELFDSLPTSKKEDTMAPAKTMPLAKRMCPQTLDEMVGQEHILGQGKLLRRLIEADRVVSLILYGPPGTGKTSLCTIIGNRTKAQMEKINATLAGVDEVRQVIKRAQERKRLGQKTILFVDEIHHFNKTQQDAFLNYVEEGLITLIASTTHNPFFYINPALLSRSQIFEFKSLTQDDLRKLAQRALQDQERGLGRYSMAVDDTALEYLIKSTDGDARQTLNALEVGALTTPPDAQGRVVITLAVAEECLQKKRVLYDNAEDAHYDTISAFIKSLRGSDPDAALYWMAKMLHGGEDPRFIARRLVILASEDIGNADPQALLIATAAFQAVETIGLPEARLNLAQAVTYLACAPKSNASTVAIGRATEDVESKPLLAVPRHLQDAHYKGAKKLGRGEGYVYPHNDPRGYVDQPYLPENKKYYEPTEHGYEAVIKKRMEELKKGDADKGKA